MNKVIALDKSLDLAVNEAISSAEKGDFNKTIELLTYIKKYKKNYDEIMVNYFLLYSHFALGEIDNANYYLNILEELDIHNEQIIAVVNEIKREINAIVPFDEINNIINDLYKRCEDNKIFNPDRQGYFLEILYSKDDPASFTILKEMYEEAKDVITFMSSTKNYDYLHETVVNYDVKTTMQVLNRLLINGFYWELLDEEQFSMIVNSTIKNDVIVQIFKCIAINYSSYTSIDKHIIKKHCKINIKEQKFDMIDIFDSADTVDRILKTSNKINWTIIVDTVMLYVGTNNFYDSKILFNNDSLATICYALNKQYGLDMKKDIYKYTNVKYEELMYKVDKIIDFLNS